MARIMGIDYGTKRVGLSVTDPLQIIVTGLDTVPNLEVFNYLEKYFSEEEVEKVVIGEPFYPDGNPAQIHHLVIGFYRNLKKRYPNKEFVLHDESFSSENAKMVIRNSGLKQKKRRDKSLVDKVSAVLILQDYLGHI